MLKCHGSVYFKCGSFHCADNKKIPFEPDFRCVIILVISFSLSPFLKKLDFYSRNLVDQMLDHELICVFCFSSHISHIYVFSVS